MRTLILAVTLLLLPLANFAAGTGSTTATLLQSRAMFAQVEAAPVAAKEHEPADTALMANEPKAKAHAEKEEGLPLHPIVITHIGPLPITNSMVVTWIVAAFLIIFAHIAMRNMQMIPVGLQNFWEWMVESLHKFLEGIIGHQLVKKTFWFFATIFIFILFCNWFGLDSGRRHRRLGHRNRSWLRPDVHPLFRGANADLNMTLAMAMVFFACWIFWALQANGVGGFLMHLFGPKGETTGVLKVLMIVVFFVVGFLEVVSILFRPVSLSFRLYGNIFAGENMLEAMSTRCAEAWHGCCRFRFIFMELLVGLVQALVFMLLTAVFTLLICRMTRDTTGARH